MATDLDYSNTLIKSIDFMIDEKLKKASFDKTIKATVLSCENIEKGEYLVKYQDATFNAYTNNINIIYQNNSFVYILIPEGNHSNTKIILYGDTYSIAGEEE